MTKQHLARLARRLMHEHQPAEARRVGKLRIESHTVEGKLPVVTFREMIHTGLPELELDCKGYVKQSLIGDDNGTWMTNMPCELVQMWRELAGRARGRVLIGGLGLGIVAKMVAAKKTVKSVTVVEISQDVIDLIGPIPRVEIVRGDIRKFIKGPLPYDWALLDTWQSDGEWTWQSQVVPMRRVIGDRIPHVACWHENVMRGQVWGFPGSGLFRAADVAEEDMRTRHHCHWYAFRKAAIHAGFRNGPRIGNDMMAGLQIALDNSSDPDLQALAQAMVHGPGKPIWERLFGRHWDEAWNEGK